MFISVKVITRARREKAERQADGSFKVWVRAAPEKGKANERVLSLLAEELGIKKSALKMTSGQKFSKKKFEVLQP